MVKKSGRASKVIVVKAAKPRNVMPKDTKSPVSRAMTKLKASAKKIIN